MKSFFDADHPLLTAMAQAYTPENAVRLGKLALADGADALGFQVCRLRPEYLNKATVQRIFSTFPDVPIYATNYRVGSNEGKSDDELAEGIVQLAECGASLCDVMGDLFDRDPTDELTMNPAAIARQQVLIARIHDRGAKVLMSSHTYHFRPAERVLEIARAQQERGADYVKIVTGADTMAEQIENLRITALLRETLRVPFLFLSGGECRLHRVIGIKLGCGMALCVHEHDELATPVQPLVTDLRAIADHL